MSKRKRPDSRTPPDALTEHERKVYNAIQSKQEMGMNKFELKEATGILDSIMTRSLKSLLAKSRIKEVQNIHKKGLKHYMAIEFEPSQEITGGAWYADGNLDTSFIEALKASALRFINNRKVATFETLSDLLINKVAKVTITKKQVEEVLRSMVLDNDIVEVKSNGMGDFAAIPVGQVCYKRTRKQSGDAEPRIGALASVPCGVCPRISLCTPGGPISPLNCVYYAKWLDF